MSTTKKEQNGQASTTLGEVFSTSHSETSELVNQDRAGVTIYETDNYDLFSYAASNRKVNPNYVEDLKASMEEVGFLPAKPVLVDKNGVVVDGQHSLKAAKQLGIKVPYAVLDGEYDQDLVVRLNMTQEKWGMEDFVEGYAEQGMDQYQTYLDFQEEYDFPISVPGRIIGMKNKTIKRGRLEWPDNDGWAHDIANVSSTVRDATGEKFAQSQSFISALKQVLGRDEVTGPTELARKTIEAINQGRLHKCKTVDDYRRGIAEAWNFHRAKNSRKYITMF